MTVELAIVGAGPAGMAAAALAAELGLDTVLVDDQEMPGGQIYRAIERAAADTPLGRDYLAGRPLAAALRASRIDYRPATMVWHIDADNRLYLAREGRTETVAARRIVLATGAFERPVPIPGWTLPGVMTAGAAQTLLKTADLMPEGRIVLAGQGPLLYLIAMQLVRAGAPPTILLETTPPENYWKAARRWRTLWPGRRMLAKGAGLLLALARAGVPIRRGVRGLRALGRGSLERVGWEGGEIAADHLLLHEGVIPNVQASLALGLRHEWDEDQLCWRPALDEWGRTSVSGISVAGDGGGIAGAAAAALSGRLAALDAALALGRIGEEEGRRRADPIRAALARERALRPFLDRLYHPPQAVLAPPEGEIVACRCEEVTVREIRRAARLGAPGLNQMKAFTRCGMGPCQGRICGPIAAAIMADALDKSIAEIGTWRPRAPWKPITVGALADLDTADAEAAAPATSERSGI
jgi:NADPH-dependent 2,4-dienoyl-CoA reductase/sulfur reductase-like enzyme